MAHLTWGGFLGRVECARESVLEDKAPGKGRKGRCVMSKADLRDLEASEAEMHQDVLEQLLAVVAELEAYEIEETDVRLQVSVSDGDECVTWVVHSGSSDYDKNHRGYWCAASVSADYDERQCVLVARDLVEQALEQAAISG